MIDYLVMGAGLSGLMSAYAAVQSGHRVKVIAKGLGALHWGAGSIDVLGYLPQARDAVVRRPLERLADLPADHPYTILGPAAVQDGLDKFMRLTEELGLPYYGAEAAGENLLLPSPAGALRPAFLAPAAQSAGAASDGAPMLIVGFERLRDFYPELIAENLTRQGIAARAVKLPYELLSDRRDANTVQLAQELDDENRTERLAEFLREAVRPGERIGLPALLGLTRHAQVVTRLALAAGAPVFEIPTLPPSVPGIRLFNTLRAGLEARGVRVEAGMEVIEMNAEEGVIRWVASETSARPLRHRAERFVLATGGILGGGFMSDHTGRIWETVFDLPLTTPQSRSQWFRPAFLAPDGHPVFQGGVRVNAAFQPVDAQGAPCFANLHVVGGALAGCDPLAERSLEGLAIATGMNLLKE
ncbi:MAG: glycerol-3-phosphate dehydrogenase subunit GlpB [Caldilineaceae bacterium]|nr:glycerol-3-phosphate dehydrogenase subunit GlpB [Caldilineaceae bacterium]